jgi:hypothetical protein
VIVESLIVCKSLQFYFGLRERPHLLRVNFDAPCFDVHEFCPLNQIRSRACFKGRGAFLSSSGAPPNFQELVVPAFHYGFLITNILRNIGDASVVHLLIRRKLARRSRFPSPRQNSRPFPLRAALRSASSWKRFSISSSDISSLIDRPFWVSRQLSLATFVTHLKMGSIPKECYVYLEPLVISTPDSFDCTLVGVVHWVVEALFSRTLLRVPIIVAHRGADYLFLETFLVPVGSPSTAPSLSTPGVLSSLPRL